MHDDLLLVEADVHSSHITKAFNRVLSGFETGRYEIVALVDIKGALTPKIVCLTARFSGRRKEKDAWSSKDWAPRIYELFEEAIMTALEYHMCLKT